MTRENRLAAIESRLTTLTWMAGVNVALTLLTLTILAAGLTRLGELSQQLQQVVQRLH